MLRFVRILCAWLFLSFLPGTYAAGVTLFTHGFNSDIDDWVIAMAGALTRYPRLEMTNTICYEIYFELNTSGEYEPRQRKLHGGDPTTADSGEIFIKLNWSPLAGDLSGVPYSTYDVAPSVASTLTAPGFIPELQGRPLAQMPLHLIGHSRGGSLICEVAKILGQTGIWVDQITTLDPHPLNNDYDDSILTDIVDAPAVPYVNVLFADNYYQVNNSFLGLDPSGQYVPGAYNRYLNVQTGGYTGFARNHSNVHLWYHGTIDWTTPASDSLASITAAERSAWWTMPENSGASAGMHYARLGEGNRLSTEAPSGGTNLVANGMNQIWDFGAGLSQNRFSLPENTLEWPSLITLRIDPPELAAARSGPPALSFEAGSPLSLSCGYQSGSAPATLTFFLDADFNPWSGKEISFTNITLSAGTPEVVEMLAIEAIIQPTIPPGKYALAAAISSGDHTRYLYAPDLLQLLAPAKPVQFTLASAAPGEFQARLTGPIGQSVVVEQTTDLITWTPVETNTLSADPWIFIRQIPSGTHHQIFRARSLN